MTATAPSDTIDPVAGPSAYRATLLGRLDGRDAATVQAETPAEIRRLIAAAGRHLRERPKPGEWSVLEIVGHIVDAELVVGSRYRFILAHEEPAILPYDQDLWATRLRHNEADPDELVGPFVAMRRANLALWRRTPVNERSRVGIHQERGRESYDLTFRMLAGHDLIHLAQAWETLGALRAAAGAPAGTTESR